MTGRDATHWDVSAETAGIHRSALVWDNHAGFPYRPELGLDDLEHWRAAGVDYVSVNIGYDVTPWELAVEAVAAYRHWIRANSDRYVQVATVEDVHLARRQSKLAVAFDLEGMNALNGGIGMVDLYYRLGVRQMLFAYNRNNLAGGGCHDEDGGLTQFGRAVIREMNRLGMVVDCSHCGFRTAMEAIEASEAPVIFSHSNARDVWDHGRNIRDEQMKACAARGGVVGVTGVGLFIGRNGARLEDLVAHVDHIVERIGPEHVGIGLDSIIGYEDSEKFALTDRRYWPADQYPDEGTDFVPPAALPRLTEALLDRGYRQEDVRGILGENFLRIASRVWKPPPA